MQSSTEMTGTEIAVVGMAGKFPGANSVDELWENLKNGVESVSSISLEEWAAEVDVHPSFLERPDLVPMRPRIEGADLFDAAFFGYTPREAQILDPQQRLFLECCWEALESAGYDTERFAGSIGLAAGVSQSSYLMNYLQWDRELIQAMGNLKVGLGNMNDALPTRVAYKLNLRGPAYAVQSFCSTSLLAVHLACQSLLNHESDLALAGGVTIAVSQNTGYQYMEGGILSPDGHTRTFDARGKGMVFGNGLGAVVLKRLKEAVRDGDNVRAVILGSAINNDGSVKVGFTAPSVSGQAEVIVEALSAADVNPETITYVEAHGTATALGDPAEIAGLTKAWRKWTGRKRYCAIGSVKTNIGHLDAAAGVAGLIKTVLALEHRQIPASLHFEAPNPEIDFAGSPFYVVTELTPWNSEGPRRAGISSFGIGGTNAHAILQEAPLLPPSDPARPWQLLVASAKTATALDEATRKLTNHLTAHPDTNLADAAWTLQVGRRVFNHRRVVVGRDLEDARAALGDPARWATAAQERQNAPVAFMFTGQGSQYVGMGRGLYEEEPVFREAVDAGAELLRSSLGLDLRGVLYPRSGHAEAAAEQLMQTQFTQPALFLVEYALARLWMSWGIQPVAMIGHSVGEYVAAHLAGVFSFEDALALVAERGRLMQSLPRGAMLSVPLGEAALRPHLGAGLDLASVNAPGACAVAGSAEAIDRLERELAERGVPSRRLHTSHAFHSAMMEPILPAFRRRVGEAERRTPSLRFVSNVTGDWITAGEAMDAEYWVRHLRGTVRFGEGVKRLIGEESRPVLLEVGPGNTLVSLARQQGADTGAAAAVASLRHVSETLPDRAFLLGSLGKLWLAGVNLDWVSVHGEERRRRVALPSYPFERQRFWVDRNEKRQLVESIAQGYSLQRREVQDWFYQPSWRRFLPAELLSTPFPPGGSRWLLFLDEEGLGAVMAEQLTRAGQTVMTVRRGRGFATVAPNSFEIDPRERADYVTLLRTLQDGPPQFVVHLWGLTRDDSTSNLDRVEEAQTRGFYSVLFLAQGLAGADFRQPLHMAVVTNNMQEVVGSELTCPEKATVLGPCKVIPQEMTQVSCQSIDVDLPTPGSAQAVRLADRIVAELLTGQPEPVVAYRGPHRWVQSAEPTPLAPPNGVSRLRKGGTYLITGGLGGIGLVFAQHLAENWKARLALTGRSLLPPREEWEVWLEQHGRQDATSQRIGEIRDLEGRGGEVLYLRADVASREDMEGAVVATRKRFGPIQGVIHSAGVAGGGIISLKERDVAARVMAPKVQGTLVLEAALREESLDFFLLCSSTAALLGGLGQVDYCGANAFLDAYAHRARAAGGPPAISVNWDAWREVGMAVNTPVSGALQAARDFSLKVGIAPREGVDALGRILAAGVPQVVVFTMDMRPALLQPQLERKATPPALAGTLEPTSEVRAVEQDAFSGDLERMIAETWERILGRKEIGVDDNFFELGGDSLTALQVIPLLRTRLGKEIPIVTFYEAPTVGLLARALRDRTADEPVVLEEVGQRAETRLDLMRRRRQQREIQPALDPLA
ncbi:MAG TPA: SDR family NAD(P)-dependent oxidoreductase [Vicinamibacteria bacterium]|nr:SDR family NAD(P)-dependent oxidoreductase [Vicinamibacteria bacterium]